MDTQTIFEEFLDRIVNLNNDRVNRIKDAQRILSKFIRNQEEFKDLYIDTIPQGSYRQKTIIKPVGDDGTFDVDLLIKLNENQDWTPADYHAKLATTFRESGRYEDLTDTKGKTRCVTIDYEGDFHVDLVPVVKRGADYYVCDKTKTEFKDEDKTDGDGYAQWFEQQDTNADGYLVPVVRLLKYLRDSKEDFDTKSIILTTVAGMQVIPDDSFASIPEALSAILERMNHYLSQFEIAPSIPNPAMPGEYFDRHWKDDEKGFNKLKVAIGVYADIADNAMEAENIEDAIKQWQKLLGDDFIVEDTDSKSSTGSTAPTLAVGMATRSFTPGKPYASEE